MEEDKFKKLIQNIGLEEPGAYLTDNIMEIIETKEELRLNPALLSVVKNELLADTSPQFSDTLMGKIKPKGSINLEPVIAKKTGLIILSIFSSIVFLVLICPHPSIYPLQNVSYFSHFNLNLSGTIMGIIKIATSVFPYLITLSSLLFIDYLFRTRQSRLYTG